ncbi:MAG TPA: transglutaminase [Sulfurimonas sp.]|nr:transglutaminase [Sulfurimonas sp.]
MKQFFIFFLIIYLSQGFNAAEISAGIIEKIQKKYGVFAKNRFLAYNEMILSLKHKSEKEKLDEVNEFYNNVPYKSDIKNWKQKDYWATPIELLAKDKGDCEDYVIAKLFALKSLGIDSNKLFMTYVKSSRFKAPHMVLTYFETPSSQPLILDNTNFKVLPASRRTDLTPIYNFNGDSLFQARKKGKGKKVKIHPKTHKKWDNLINRIQRNQL